MPTKVKAWTKGTVYSEPGHVNVFPRTTYNSSSNTTLTPSGKKDFRAQNPFTISVKDLLRYSQNGLTLDNYHVYLDEVAQDWSRVDNRAYSKFQGRLRYGSANLGVTLGEWKSSSEMIYNRSIGLVKALDRANSQLLRDRRLREKIKKRGLLMRDIIGAWDDQGNVTRYVDRKIDPRKRRQISPSWSLRPGAYVKDAADLNLEYTFGWTPLVQDMHAAFTTVCRDGIPDNWVSVRATEFVEKTSVRGATGGHLERVELQTYAKFSTTYSANVQISNPNLWLLNRLGLVNPAVVAWDLVPWSFVVGMFVNINQMLMSMSDEVGLTLTNQSITRTSLRYVYAHRKVNPWSGYPPGTSAMTHWKIFYKNRTVGVALRPTLNFHVPELNLDLLLTATSLVVQRMAKITKLLS